MAKEIFISYSRKDFNTVQSIKAELDRELNVDCWFDIDGVESGEQFEKKIISAISSHDIFLFMLSPNSMASEYALDELSFAKRKNKRIVIIFITTCEMTDEFAFKYQKYDAIEWFTRLQHDKLIRDLRVWLNLTAPQPTQTISPKPMPSVQQATPPKAVVNPYIRYTEGFKYSYYDALGEAMLVGWGSVLRSSTNIAIPPIIRKDGKVYKVTSIKNDIFDGNYFITSLVVPSTVEKLSNYCFSNCTALESLIIEEGVKVIRLGAFKGCSNLKSVSLPNSLQEIENYAFEGCTALRSVVVPLKTKLSLDIFPLTCKVTRSNPQTI